MDDEKHASEGAVYTCTIWEKRKMRRKQEVIADGTERFFLECRGRMSSVSRRDVYGRDGMCEINFKIMFVI